MVTNEQVFAARKLTYLDVNGDVSTACGDVEVRTATNNGVIIGIDNKMKVLIPWHRVLSLKYHNYDSAMRNTVE